jgi:hypothetical protein
MPLASTPRTILKWMAGLLFLARFGFLGFQAAAAGLNRRDLVLDHTTFETICGILFFIPAAFGLTILRRSRVPSRGGEMGAYRGPTPRR